MARGESGFLVRSEINPRAKSLLPWLDNCESRFLEIIAVSLGYLKCVCFRGPYWPIYLYMEDFFEVDHWWLDWYAEPIED